MTNQHTNLFESKIPEGFIMPQWENDKYFARMLKMSDCYIDYINVMDSMEVIPEARGGIDWPTPDLTIEDNLISLGYHQRQSEYNQGFSYIVFTRDTNEYFGCFYIYPMGFRTPVNDENTNFDADISFWITKKFYSKDLYFNFWEDLQVFIKENYPFFKFYFSNKLKP
jgi:hypothetical protein